MNPRFAAIMEISKRTRPSSPDNESAISSETFGKHVFNRAVMRRMLPPEVYANVIDAMENRDKIKPEHSDTIAVAMKEWAVTLGATHYTHWFQPLTGATAEKHDAFIEWTSTDEVIEKFSGKQLIQGEPDASSFPSGGLRSTYEARGYTGWDPTSPVFVWKAGDGVTLCIPSVFFSWTGYVLDTKIPLLRSDRKINDAVLRLLKLTGIEATHVYSTLGLEQEYFVIDRALRDLRPDLVLMGRTVYGASSPKGQELQDHYFGAVKDRVLGFMRDFEVEALKLGIPVKTRHNEVAPAQHEVAPVYEKASVAIDHNILLMELMRQVATRNDLACLLHEKPFHNLNGSGKHSNWSLATDTGINLLDPSDTPGHNLHFLILITAILHAVYEHSTLLRASIGSASNDYRLGGHEAPPAIISVYLGKEIEAILDHIEEKGAHHGARRKETYDLGLGSFPDLSKDHTDRNRTSPFAFTGNKFEFRAVGSSMNPSFPTTVLNVIVANALNHIVDEIEEHIGKKSDEQDIIDAVITVIRKYIKSSKGIRFDGDNYSHEWETEAKKRKLPIFKKSVQAFEALKSDKTAEAFQGVLTKQELESRYEIMVDNYANTLNIEANLMIELFRTQIYPAAMHHQRQIAESIHIYTKTMESTLFLSAQTERLKMLAFFISEAARLCEELEQMRQKLVGLPGPERAKLFADKIVNHCNELRAVVDQLETMVEDKIWPLPKYRELLFMI